MKTESKTYFAIVPPDHCSKAEKKEWQTYSKESIAETAEKAWEKFCYPSLRRKGYEDEGFKAKKFKGD